MHRRKFLGRVSLGGLALGGGGCVSLRETGADTDRQRLFFVSGGKTCLIRADGSGLEPLEFDLPGQVTWQPGPFFSDGKRMIFLSMETRRDGPGRSFDQYYTLTPTHLWLYDLDRKSLVEIGTSDRQEVFYTPQLLISDERMLVQVPRSKMGQVLSMNLDGSDARPFTKVGEGLPYGFSVSADHQRVAFHLASPNGYQVWTSDAEGGNRKLVAAHPDHLYFGPSWSPDGQWLMFQDCLFKADPGHDTSDICVARPDGSELRVLTRGQAQWFAATYGNPKHRGGGSNMPAWTGDGQILFSRRLPGSRVAWEYQANRPDTDHFNRDWKPEKAQGGTEICRLNPKDGSVRRLTASEPPLWDFRASESPDQKRVAFCRCATGETPALWVMNALGGGERLLTRGLDESGADHPRWLPRATP
jgi:Tol biopolymer transport system component